MAPPPLLVLTSSHHFRTHAFTPEAISPHQFATRNLYFSFCMRTILNLMDDVSSVSARVKVNLEQTHAFGRTIQFRALYYPFHFTHPIYIIGQPRPPRSATSTSGPCAGQYYRPPLRADKATVPLSTSQPTIEPHPIASLAPPSHIPPHKCPTLSCTLPTIS